VVADESLVSTLVQRGVDPDPISEARLWSMSHRKMADRKGPRKLVEGEQCAVWSVIRHVLELYMNACVARSWKAPSSGQSRRWNIHVYPSDLVPNQSTSAHRNRLAHSQLSLRKIQEGMTCFMILLCFFFALRLSLALGR